MPYRTIAECDECHKQVDTKSYSGGMLGIYTFYVRPNDWVEVTVKDKNFILCSSECASKYLAKMEMTYEGN